TSTSSPLSLPMEIRFDDLPGGTPVEVVITGYPPGETLGPLVTRIASTEIVAGKTPLLPLPPHTPPRSPVRRCRPPRPHPRTAHQTWLGGQCADGHIAASTLEASSPSWSGASSDPCKPAGGGMPVVIVGQGQADYLPMMDGDTAQVEQGPQGGHHIWVAIRAK